MADFDRTVDTGSLDTATAGEIMDLLRRRTEGGGVILVFLVLLGVLTWAILAELERGQDEPQVVTGHCPDCRGTVEADWLLCPRCSHLLRESCADCGRATASWHSYCPWCGSRRGGQ
ncbi:MAG: double zinc ribbon domain-containing protein [Trichloromonadaceae bacterium]